MGENENLSDEPEFKIFDRFDKERDINIRKKRFIEKIDELLQKNRVSEVMVKNVVELLEINPAYYWPRKYRYTLEPDAGKLNPLTVQQRNQFERNGYLVIKNLLSKELLSLFSDCPKEAFSEVLSLVINQRELVNKVKPFCGEQTKHIATMIIDNLYIQSLNSSINATKNELNQELISVSKLAQHFYSFNVHPADRLLGCLILVENSNKFQICLEPASHQSSVLKIEMRGLDGELVKKIYEKPIRRLETLNEQTKRRELVTLKPGDVLFYHPLSAQSILFDQTSKEKNSIENLNLTKNTNLNKENRILALNVFYGSANLMKVIRNYGISYAKSASFHSPFQRLKLLDQLLEAEDQRENQLLKEVDKLLEQDQVHEKTNDLKSPNVQIYIGNSIVNLEKILTDAGQTNLESHL